MKIFKRFPHKNKSLRLSDVLVLRANVERGAAHPEVGHLDANRTYKDLMLTLNHEVYVPRSVLESALFSCNLLDESGEFIHPEGLTYDQFLVRLKIKFNKRYNWIEEDL